MAYLEHEENNPNCDCPTCHLTNLYIEEYKDYKGRAPYRTFEVTATGDGPGAETAKNLNHNQRYGYEFLKVIPGHRSHNRIVVLRSVPPTVPSAVDILIETERRKEGEQPKEMAEGDFKTIGKC